ncbi:MAG: RnfH family protein [Burkholderiales bacterium]
MSERIRVHVVHALPARQATVEVMLSAGSTVRDAVDASGLAGRFDGITAGQSPVGIWGRPTVWDAVLREGDRVELYRPLLADPKDVRRKRARRSSA